MNKVLCVALLMCASVVANAEVQDWDLVEHNFSLGGGIFMESGSTSVNPGFVSRFSYGADFRFHKNWSVMPGITITSCKGDMSRWGAISGVRDGFVTTEIFCQMRWHVYHGDNFEVAFSAGPEMSCMLMPAKYIVEYNPSAPLHGQRKYRILDLGLKPGIMFMHGEHWQWGIDLSVGLLNRLIQYPKHNITGDAYLSAVMLAIGYRF
ncbi:MAG: outer membrane beta-barrel protein [Bacteroidales bacterium]|nr:outer membrane beta-barrel protein [Bacteroidales bacterium]